MSNFSISPDTLIGSVSLTVADLERSTRFYEDVFGLKLLQQKSHTAIMLRDPEGNGMLLTAGQPRSEEVMSSAEAFPDV
jgi:catechol-2,3-dioxygenase